MKKVEIAICMGSQSDWPTMKKSAEILDEFDINYLSLIISAHRTPDRLFKFGENAENDGFKVLIAGAGGAAHLPGMLASKTNLPVIGVPIKTKFLSGLDSLYSILQMPTGFPVNTMAIGETGAKNAAIMAISILSISNKNYQERLKKWKSEMSKKIELSPTD